MLLTRDVKKPPHRCPSNAGVQLSVSLDGAEHSENEISCNTYLPFLPDTSVSLFDDPLSQQRVLETLPKVSNAESKYALVINPSVPCVNPSHSLLSADHQLLNHSGTLGHPGLNLQQIYMADRCRNALQTTAAAFTDLNANHEDGTLCFRPYTALGDENIPVYLNAAAAPNRLPAHKPVRLQQPKHPLAPPGTAVFFKYGEEHYPEDTIPAQYTLHETDGTICRYITNFLVYNKRGERLLPVEVLDQPRHAALVLYGALLPAANMSQSDCCAASLRDELATHKRKRNLSQGGLAIPCSSKRSCGDGRTILPSMALCTKKASGESDKHIASQLYPVRVELAEWCIDYGQEPTNVPYIWLISCRDVYYRLEKPAGRYIPTFATAKMKFEVLTRVIKTLQFRPCIEYSALVDLLTAATRIKIARKQERRTPQKGKDASNATRSSATGLDEALRGNLSRSCFTRSSKCLKRKPTDERSDELLSECETDEDDASCIMPIQADGASSEVAATCDVPVTKKKNRNWRIQSLSTPQGTGVQLPEVDGQAAPLTPWGAPYAVDGFRESMMLGLADFVESQIKNFMHGFGGTGPNLLNTPFLQTLREKAAVRIDTLQLIESKRRALEMARNVRLTNGSQGAAAHSYGPHEDEERVLHQNEEALLGLESQIAHLKATLRDSDGESGDDPYFCAGRSSTTATTSDVEEGSQYYSERFSAKEHLNLVCCRNAYAPLNYTSFASSQRYNAAAVMNPGCGVVAAPVVPGQLSIPHAPTDDCSSPLCASSTWLRMRQQQTNILCPSQHTSGCEAGELNYYTVSSAAENVEAVPNPELSAPTSVVDNHGSYLFNSTEWDRGSLGFADNNVSNTLYSADETFVTQKKDSAQCTATESFIPQTGGELSYYDGSYTYAHGCLPATPQLQQLDYIEAPLYDHVIFQMAPTHRMEPPPKKNESTSPDLTQQFPLQRPQAEISHQQRPSAAGPQFYSQQQSQYVLQPRPSPMLSQYDPQCGHMYYPVQQAAAAAMPPLSGPTSSRSSSQQNVSQQSSVGHQHHYGHASFAPPHPQGPSSTNVSHYQSMDASMFGRGAFFDTAQAGTFNPYAFSPMYAQPTLPHMMGFTVPPPEYLCGGGSMHHWPNFQQLAAAQQQHMQRLNSQIFIYNNVHPIARKERSRSKAHQAEEQAAASKRRKTSSKDPQATTRGADRLHSTVPSAPMTVSIRLPTCPRSAIDDLEVPPTDLRYYRHPFPLDKVLVPFPVPFALQLYDFLELIDDWVSLPGGDSPFPSSPFALAAALGYPLPPEAPSPVDNTAIEAVVALLLRLHCRRYERLRQVEVMWLSHRVANTLFTPTLLSSDPSLLMVNLQGSKSTDAQTLEAMQTVKEEIKPAVSPPPSVTMPPPGTAENTSKAQSGTVKVDFCLTSRYRFRKGPPKKRDCLDGGAKSLLQTYHAWLPATVTSKQPFQVLASRGWVNTSSPYLPLEVVLSQPVLRLLGNMRTLAASLRLQPSTRRASDLPEWKVAQYNVTAPSRALLQQLGEALSKSLQLCANRSLSSSAAVPAAAATSAVIDSVLAEPTGESAEDIQSHSPPASADRKGLVAAMAHHRASLMRLPRASDLTLQLPSVVQWWKDVGSIDEVTWVLYIRAALWDAICDISSDTLRQRRAAVESTGGIGRKNKRIKKVFRGTGSSTQRNEESAGAGDTEPTEDGLSGQPEIDTALATATDTTRSSLADTGTGEFLLDEVVIMPSEEPVLSASLGAHEGDHSDYSESEKHGEDSAQADYSLSGEYSSATRCAAVDGLVWSWQLDPRKAESNGFSSSGSGIRALEVLKKLLAVEPKAANASLHVGYWLEVNRAGDNSDPPFPSLEECDSHFGPQYIVLDTVLSCEGCWESLQREDHLFLLSWIVDQLVKSTLGRDLVERKADVVAFIRNYLLACERNRTAPLQEISSAHHAVTVGKKLSVKSPKKEKLNAKKHTAVESSEKNNQSAERVAAENVVAAVVEIEESAHPSAVPSPKHELKDGLHGEGTDGSLSPVITPTIENNSQTPAALTQPAAAAAICSPAEAAAVLHEERSKVASAIDLLQNLLVLRKDHFGEDRFLNKYYVFMDAEQNATVFAEVLCLAAIEPPVALQLQDAGFLVVLVEKRQLPPGVATYNDINEKHAIPDSLSAVVLTPSGNKKRGVRGRPRKSRVLDNPAAGPTKGGEDAGEDIAAGEPTDNATLANNCDTGENNNSQDAAATLRRSGRSTKGQRKSIDYGDDGIAQSDSRRKDEGGNSITAQFLHLPASPDGNVFLRRPLDGDFYLKCATPFNNDASARGCLASVDKKLHDKLFLMAPKAEFLETPSGTQTTLLSPDGLDSGLSVDTVVIFEGSHQTLVGGKRKTKEAESSSHDSVKPLSTYYAAPCIHWCFIPSSRAVRLLANSCSDYSQRERALKGAFAQILTLYGGDRLAVPVKDELLDGAIIKTASSASNGAGREEREERHEVGSVEKEPADEDEVKESAEDRSDLLPSRQLVPSVPPDLSFAVYALIDCLMLSVKKVTHVVNRLASFNEQVLLLVASTWRSTEYDALQQLIREAEGIVRSLKVALATLCITDVQEAMKRADDLLIGVLGTMRLAIGIILVMAKVLRQSPLLAKLQNSAPPSAWQQRTGMAQWDCEIRAIEWALLNCGLYRDELNLTAGSALNKELIALLPTFLSVFHYALVSLDARVDAGCEETAHHVRTEASREDRICQVALVVRTILSDFAALIGLMFGLWNRFGLNRPPLEHLLGTSSRDRIFLPWSETDEERPSEKRPIYLRLIDREAYIASLEPFRLAGICTGEEGVPPDLMPSCVLCVEHTWYHSPNVLSPCTSSNLAAVTPSDAARPRQRKPGNTHVSPQAVPTTFAPSVPTPNAASALPPPAQLPLQQQPLNDTFPTYFRLRVSVAAPSPFQGCTFVLLVGDADSADSSGIAVIK